MGLGSLLKKASPVSIDKKIAGSIIKPLAEKTGDKLLSSAAGTVAKTDTSSIIARNQYAEHKVGGTFRDIDRAGGKFTPLQIDNAIARTANDWTGGRDAGTGLVTLTTTRGPKDGSNDWYYDSDRNVSLAAAGVIGGFAAAGATASAGSAEGLYAVNAFDTGAMATSVGYTSPGWAGSSSAALLAENSFDTGAMWSATGNTAAPWYEGFGSSLAKFLGGGFKGTPIAGTPNDTGTYQPLTDESAAPAAAGSNALWWALGFAAVAGLAIAYKKGLIHG